MEDHEQYIKRPQRDITNLKIDQALLNTRVSKYEELTSRLDRVQTQLQRDLQQRS